MLQIGALGMDVRSLDTQELDLKPYMSLVHNNSPVSVHNTTHAGSMQANVGCLLYCTAFTKHLCINI